MKHRYRRKDYACVLCDKPTRDWNHICVECKQDYRRGVLIREHEEDKAASGKSEFVPILWYWHLYKPRHEPPGERRTIESAIRKATLHLVGGIKHDHRYSGRRYYGTRNSQIGKPYDKGYDGSLDLYEFPQRGTWKALQDLTHAIADFGHYQYTEGFAAGNRLLYRLSKGELSVDEFNERSTRRVSG